MRHLVDKYFWGRTKIYQHGVWWSCFISYELSVYYFSTGSIGYPARHLIYYSLNILLFYNHLRTLNKTLGRSPKSRLKLFLYVAAELVVFLGIKFAFDLYFHQAPKTEMVGWVDIKQMFALDAYRCVFFIGLSSLYWAGSRISGFERTAKEAEISRLKAAGDALNAEAKLARSENALLRQQINPHLMFNSLNFIYSTVYKVSEEAASHVILLTDILRFAYEEGGADGKVYLEEEVEQVQNLIRINQARFNHALAVPFEISGPITQQRIIPLVLMTLVENVFKHGDLRAPGTKISLELSDYGTLLFTTRNKTKATVPYPRLRSTGLANIRVRLDFAYGTKYSLESMITGPVYETRLQIKL